MTPLYPGRDSMNTEFQIKPAHEDTSERYNDRLVAKGHTQKYAIDYHEKFTLVVKHKALRVRLANVSALDLEIIQLEIKTDFHKDDGVLNKEIFTDNPEGFIKQGREKEVCHLRKSFHGLKQAPRVLNTII